MGGGHASGCGPGASWREEHQGEEPPDAFFAAPGACLWKPLAGGRHKAKWPNLLEAILDVKSSSLQIKVGILLTCNSRAVCRTAAGVGSQQTCARLV